MPMRYDVQTDVYDGPLGLLVELAKLNLLDLFLIKLRELTAQYLAVVKRCESSLNELAEPLPLLGQLMALKARLLLPQPPAAPEDEEAPVSLEELKRRLAEYEQFKSVAQVLGELHALQHEHFTRGGPEELPGDASAADRPLEVGIMDLMSAFAKVLEKSASPLYEVITEPWTVEMKVGELKLLLTSKQRVGFLELFSPEKTKLELVVTFLALLELVRQRVCMAIQEEHFSDIMIVRRDAEAHA